MAVTRIPLGLSLEALPAPHGALVRGMDFSVPLGSDEVDQITSWMHQYLLLCFRGHHSPTDEELVAFAANFGHVERNDIVPDLVKPGFPEIIIISNIVKDGKVIGAGKGSSNLGWHADYEWNDRVAKFGFLEAVELPSSGGNTMFANTCSAYETLPADMRRKLRSLTAVHVTDAGGYYKPDHENPVRRHEHPLVVVNPDTGRRAIYGGSMYLVELLGLPEEEGRDLLTMLQEHTTSPRFIYEHHWQVNDLVMWDELGLIHARGSFDPNARRYMRQMTVMIDDPSAPWSPEA